MTETEANTPEGDAIGAMALASSVFVTVTVISIFAIVGGQVIPLLPETITGSFTYMQASLFAAVFVNMAVKNLKPSLATLIIGTVCCYILPKAGLSSAWLTLIVVVSGMICANIAQSASSKKK